MTEEDRKLWLHMLFELVDEFSKYIYEGHVFTDYIVERSQRLVSLDKSNESLYYNAVALVKDQSRLNLFSQKALDCFNILDGLNDLLSLIWKDLSSDTVETPTADLVARFEGITLREFC